jgi:hypothetical protein
MAETATIHACRLFPGDGAPPLIDLVVDLHAAILLAPRVVGLFGYAHLADRIHMRRALTDRNVNLPQLLNYFLWLVSLVRHSLSSVS